MIQILCFYNYFKKKTFKNFENFDKIIIKTPLWKLKSIFDCKKKQVFKTVKYFFGKFLKVGNRNEGNGLGQTFNQKKIKIDNNTKEECLVY